jgi:hypothetical protein
LKIGAVLCGFSPISADLEIKRSSREAESWGDEELSQEEHQLSASLS